MSQNVSTNPKDSDPLTPPPPSSSIQPWSAEAEADKLMNELFADIDQILEGGNRLPTEPAKPEYVSLKSIMIPQLSTPPAVKPPQEELPKQSSIEPTDSKLSEPLQTDVAPKSTSSPKRSSLSFERLLLVLGFVVLGLSILLFLVSKKKLTLPEWLKPNAPPTVQTKQISAADAEFAKYMERALKAIDGKSTQKQQATIPPGGTSTTNPMPLPSPNQPVAASPPQRVIERVYIPVYPPQAPVAPSAPPSGVRPPVPNLSAPAPLRSLRPSVPLPTVRQVAPKPISVAKRAAPSPSPAAKRTAPNSSPAAKRTAPSPSPAAKRPASSPSPVAKRTAPASPKAAAPTAVPLVLPPLPSVLPSVVVPNAPVTQLPASTTKHTLVGVMEQGDRSAALFDVGGVTKYFYVGESIADSGWTLVAVENQEAVIRRNGEVRSVYAGQSF